MNTIVLNTLNGAVTEYTGFTGAVTLTHIGNHDGLFALAGDTDAGTPVVSNVVTGKKQWGSSLKKYVDILFFGLKGLGQGRLTVFGEKTSNSYNFAIEKGGESRSKPGRGIRENYLAFGFSNPDGKDFQLDRIEINIGQSGTRRTQ